MITQRREKWDYEVGGKFWKTSLGKKLRGKAFNITMNCLEAADRTWTSLFGSSLKQRELSSIRKINI
ncbi:MAG: hypothetical protein ACFFDT_39810, partial [Candidatus Hodarchaeota archaeon]